MRFFPSIMMSVPAVIIVINRSFVAKFSETQCNRFSTKFSLQIWQLSGFPNWDGHANLCKSGPMLSSCTCLDFLDFKKWLNIVCRVSFLKTSCSIRFWSFQTQLDQDEFQTQLFQESYCFWIRNLKPIRSTDAILIYFSEIILNINIINKNLPT